MLDHEGKRQQAIAFVPPPIYGAEDFMPTPACQKAFTWLESWPDQKHKDMSGVVLSGPSFCGKTHLAHLWAKRVGAHYMTYGQAIHLDIAQIARLKGSWVIDDLDPHGDRNACTTVFHLFNHLKAEGSYALWLTRAAQSHAWILPDLDSRLKSLVWFSLEDPDDETLTIIVHKILAQRHMRVSPHTLKFLFSHMERSYEALKNLAAHIDRTGPKSLTIAYLKDLWNGRNP